jgi:uncharacterized membrane protein (DUF4010 family)
VPRASVILNLDHGFTTMESSLIDLFLLFGLAGMLGFLIGLEREMSGGDSVTMGGRDFVLFALVGATSAFAAKAFGMPWAVPFAFAAVVVFIVSRYWKDDDQGPGITTEVAATLTVLLGVLVVHGAREIAIALAILTVALLAHKRAIKAFRHKIKSRDLQAALKFLIITFIVLPVLPRESLDNYLWFKVGTVQDIDPAAEEVTIDLLEGRSLEKDDEVRFDLPSGNSLENIPVLRVSKHLAVGQLPEGVSSEMLAGADVSAHFGIGIVSVVLSAIKPYTIWLIVILVSLISLVGYILIQIMGSGIGVGLTGLIGGLVSSTVTTLSFARRSLELPDLNRTFSIAILLASSMMFPRLLLEMFVVNRQLAGSVTVPLLVMSAAGFGFAFFRFFRSQRKKTSPKPVEFDNPFSLTAAVTFGLVFAGILILTRTATHYLGDAWLPVVSVISGLTDADAIAFSISDAHHSGWISLRWASLNLVLGAISNTVMKLGLVFMLADRQLFRSLVLPFAAISAIGLITTFFLYGYTPGVA